MNVYNPRNRKRNKAFFFIKKVCCVFYFLQNVYKHFADKNPNREDRDYTGSIIVLIVVTPSWLPLLASL